MIDTIRLRLHGINETKSNTLNQVQDSIRGTTSYAVPEHNDIYHALLKLKNKNSSITIVVNRETGATMDLAEEDFIKNQNAKRVNILHQTRNVMKFREGFKNNEITQSINGSMRVPSSYHGITFRINENAGYIDFEFSVPKYLYGHSLAEFIPQVLSTSLDKYPFDIHTWKRQSDLLYKRLMRVINKFFSDLCNNLSCEAMPNLRYVEIRRLDLCFNQYFKNKQEAITYLEHLRRLNYKRYKSGTKAPTDYNTSITYQSSEGSYFKIYHKGTEYSESQFGDLKKHLKENSKWIKRIREKISDRKGIYISKNYDRIVNIFRQMGKGTFLKINYDEKMIKFIKKLYKNAPYKTMFLKKEMDKVLRYEVSLRTKWFSYHYKNKVFRKDCDYHNRAKEVFKFVKSAYDSRNRDIKISNYEVKQWKLFNGWLNTSCGMMLKTDSFQKIHEKNGSDDYNVYTELYKVKYRGLENSMLKHKDTGLFSRKMLGLCIKHFKSLVDYYQIDEISDYDDLISNIKNYNDDVEKRVEMYNAVHYQEVYYDKWHNGQLIRENKRKGNRIINQAVDLLTEKEKHEKGLKKVTPLKIITVVDRIYINGEALEEVMKKMGLSPSQKTRLRRDLSKFGIGYNTKYQKTVIEKNVDWSVYYSNIQGMDYQRNFYSKLSMRHNF